MHMFCMCWGVSNLRWRATGTLPTPCSLPQEVVPPTRDLLAILTTRSAQVWAPSLLSCMHMQLSCPPMHSTLSYLPSCDSPAPTPAAMLQEPYSCEAAELVGDAVLDHLAAAFLFKALR